MPASAASAPSAPSDLAWRVIGLLNLYRLLVPIVLGTMEELAGVSAPPATSRNGGVGVA